MLSRTQCNFNCAIVSVVPADALSPLHTDPHTYTHAIPSARPCNPPSLPCAAGEEEEVDECLLGMVERPPPSLRPPGAGVVQAFRSDRQKTETASPDAILTKIVTGGPCGLWAGWVPAVRCGVPLSVLLPHQRQGALLSSQFSGWQPPSMWQRGAAQLPLPSLCSLCRAHLSPAAGHSVHQDLLDDRGRAHHQQQCRQVRGAGARGRQAVARSLHCDWNQCWPQQPPPAC
jgi:hypothetical protein